MDDSSNSTSAAASAKVGFTVGQHARLVRLKAAARYNDAVAVIANDADPQTGRFAVHLITKFPRKSLSAKPDNLTAVCNHCREKDIVEILNEESSCPRCRLPYCSKSCRGKAWSVHKALCVPCNMETAPDTPVGSADRGDEAFDAAQAYLQRACDAGNDGRTAEEVAVLKSLVEKDELQPGAFCNLFFAYKNKIAGSDPNETFRYLAKAVQLLNDSRLVQASDAQSRPDNPYDYLCMRLFSEGGEFLDGYVVGRTDLKVEEVVMIGLLEINSNNPRVSKKLSSKAWGKLGNIQRKMQKTAAAVESLRRADAAMHPRHCYHSLLLIPEVLMAETIYGTLSNHEEKAKWMEGIIDETSQVLEKQKMIPSSRRTNGCWRWRLRIF